MARSISSPFDRDVDKRLKADFEYAAAYLEELVKVPLALQLAILRRMQGVTQEKMAAKLGVKQAYVSKLERDGSDHLLSSYEKAARILRGRVVLLPEGARVVMPARRA